MNKTTFFQVATFVSAIASTFTIIFMGNKRRTKKIEVELLKEKNRSAEISAKAESNYHALEFEKEKWASLSEASRLEFFKNKTNCDRDVEVKKKEAEIANSQYLAERLKTQEAILTMSNELKSEFASDVRAEAMTKLEKDYDSFKSNVYHRLDKAEDKVDRCIDDIRKMERKYSSSTSENNWYTSYQNMEMTDELRKLRKSIERKGN